MRGIYRLAIWLIRIFMKIAGNYTIINRERISEWKSCIIAANHISYFDPPFIGSVLPEEIHFLAKSELFRIPLFGRLISFFNAIPVKRGVLDRNTIAEVKSILQNDRSILIFPEGSRKSFTAKPGIGILVHEMNVPILPVYIENTNKLSSCLLRKKRVKIYVGNLIRPEEYASLPEEKKTYRYIAENILERIKRLPDENQIS
jgi:1-acyl-sn-glycerol-3-phosphate acyltransferase